MVSGADNLKLAELQLEQEKQRTEQEKYKRDVALASLKQKVAAKRDGASARDTSTIHTPVNIELGQSSTDVVIEGQPAAAFVRDEGDAVKKYASYFRSVVKASGWEINFHPAPNPTEVKLLGPIGAVTVICAYIAEGMKNAYCALVLECSSNPSEFQRKHKELTTNYYSTEVKTPNVMLPDERRNESVAVSFRFR